MTGATACVAGLILAAGQSRRMGRPKMALAWGSGTIVEQVAQCLLDGGANPVLAVTGGDRQAVETALQGLPVGVVFNPDYETGEMISSVQVGLRALDAQTPAALIALGDQPQIQAGTVQALIGAYRESQSPLIVPSYQMRRGHPWLVGREYWTELLALLPPLTLRDFLARHATEIRYLPLDHPGVVQDIDTPEQYSQSRPE